jgi:drug/metabolite transporter (DMT)-like permease
VALVLLLALAPAGPALRAGSDDVLPILALALVPGLVALLLYYRGLRTTPAAAATLAELAFPFTALVVNAVAFDTVLTATQLAGAALLAGTVVALTFANRHGDRAVGIVPRLSAGRRTAGMSEA